MALHAGGGNGVVVVVSLEGSVYGLDGATGKKLYR